MAHDISQLDQSDLTDEKIEKKPDQQIGFRRNFLWRSMQIPLQLLCVLWFRYRAKGMEHIPSDTGALLLISHQSYLDPVLVGLPLSRPVSFLARENLFHVPIVGWILKNCFVMPINREAGGIESFRLSIKRMKQGFLVAVFPEGTRSTDGEIGTLKPGFIALARRAGVPIVPVGIVGANRAMPRGAIFIRPAKVRVYFGEPLDLERVLELSKKNQENDFLDYVHAHLQECNEIAATL
ncbi:lysophospholipid acyltransferase family protein [Rubinisphaera italica]|uniref:1-acyl-sn-glycerol-3-phosphate acyltransferase n=1 Tax=Rubinisphaera italica TaxID=2527969 RepID=A0A5C5XEN6_9PLAN|nr:lysophospholipid acyltransferase family protein [Rubinisphaera italica]TWT61254.1 1-acyl-sn-glycerol-3-phosphate acyltransferase [Rubinisphaera italica]